MPTILLHSIMRHFYQSSAKSSAKSTRVPLLCPKRNGRGLKLSMIICRTTHMITAFFSNLGSFLICGIFYEVRTRVMFWKVSGNYRGYPIVYQLPRTINNASSLGRSGSFGILQRLSFLLVLKHLCHQDSSESYRCNSAGSSLRPHLTLTLRIVQGSSRVGSSSGLAAQDTSVY